MRYDSVVFSPIGDALLALLRPVDRSRGVDEDLYGQDPSMTARILRVNTWEC